MFTALQSLPLIRFALMLGGGMVASAGGGWMMWLIGHGRWPSTEAVAIARINALTALGCGCLVIIGVVMIALAFGRVGRVAVTTAAGSLDLRFDEKDPPAAPPNGPPGLPPGGR